MYALKNLKLDALVRDTSGAPLLFNTHKQATQFLARWEADLRDYKIFEWTEK